MLEQRARVAGQVRRHQRQHLVAAALQRGSDDIRLVEAARINTYEYESQ
jgi:hypothetical protein